MKKNKKEKEKKKKKVKKDKSDSKIVRITSPINPEVVIPVLSEKADDSIIESDVLGKVVDYYVYKFPLEGKEVVGLTIKGVTETVRYINTNTKKTHMRLVLDKGSLKKEEVEREGQKGIEVTIWVDDMISGQSYPGVKFEAYMKYSKKQRSWYPNTFAVEKATSKAIRNAFRRHFPEHLVQTIIAKLMKDPKNVLALTAAPEIEAGELEQTRVVTMTPSTPQSKIAILTKKIMGMTQPNLIKDAIEKTKINKSLLPEEKSTIINLLETKLKMLKGK